MYDFIVNPHSRSGQGRQVWETVEETLKKEKVSYRVHFTRARRHATRIAAELTSDNQEHTLVVLGGDGTINEVINGIACLDRTTLGYIPTGSGNDFARGLKLPSDIHTALQTILHSSVRKKLDIGVLVYSGRRHRFAVSSGIGYDASICHVVCVSKLKTFLNKLGLGKLAYVGLSLDRLYHCRPAEMSITLNDGKVLRFNRAYFAAAMNLPYEGGGCKFCPQASPDDGLLDFIVIADVPKYRALAILPAVFSGRHVKLKGVHIINCKKAEIHSSAALPVHTDGEPVFLQRQVTMELETQALNLIVPS